MISVWLLEIQKIVQSIPALSHWLQGPRTQDWEALINYDFYLEAGWPPGKSAEWVHVIPHF